MKNPVTIENGIVFITLPTGQITMIDETDLDLVSVRSWSALPARRKRGTCYYVRTTVRTDGRDRSLLLHRLIMDPPPGLQVDHIDGNGLNNRRRNLRVCTVSQNRYNQGKLTGDQTSSFKGVCWSEERQTWQAFIAAGGRRRWLGYFKSQADAAQAYNFAAAEHHGAFACPNTVPQPWLGPRRALSRPS